MTMSLKALSPFWPPPWYQSSLASCSALVLVPERTVEVARSAWAIPWSTGAGNIRSTSSFSSVIVAFSWVSVVAGLRARAASGSSGRRSAEAGVEEELGDVDLRVGQHDAHQLGQVEADVGRLHGRHRDARPGPLLESFGEQLHVGEVVAEVGRHG